MNDEQRAALIAAMEENARSVKALDDSNRRLRDLIFSDVLEGDPIARVLFCSPVTGKIEMGANVWGDAWADYTGYATLYDAPGGKAYHTGCDLNLANYADSKKPVYAAADGVVVYCGPLSGWQRTVIVIKHTLETGVTVFTRYAHVDNAYVAKGDTVKRGSQIAIIGDYGGNGPQQDHLHYDIAFVNLESNPGDWPATDLARLKAGYMNPVSFHTQRRQ